MALALNGLYRPRARWSIRSEAWDLLRATVLMAVATFAVLFWFKLPDVSRLFLVLLFPTLYVVTLVTRAVLRLAFHQARASGRNARYVLIVGAGPRAQAFASTIENHAELGLVVVGLLDDEPEYAEGAKWPWLGKLDDLEQVMADKVIDEVAICLPFSQWEYLDGIAYAAEEAGKIVRVPMDVLRTRSPRARSRISRARRSTRWSRGRIGRWRCGSSGPSTSSSRPSGWSCSRRCSRSWAGPSGAMGDRRCSGRQRVGLHGREFQILKFRSMAVDAEERLAELESQNELEGHVFKMTDDPRITPIGRTIRRWSIDELPQLWNVLRGDMSLVGPRPPLATEVSDYDLWHRRRLSMKPGITGLWQVRSRHETVFDKWVEDDLEYIDRWSLWLDLQILVRTIPAALEGR